MEKASWDEKSNTATVTAQNLSMTATAGSSYFTANGRCFYLPQVVVGTGGSVALPVSELAKVYQVVAKWDEASSSYSIIADSPRPFASSASVYKEKDLYWLSHLINAEAGNQPLKGKIAVGDVVMACKFCARRPDVSERERRLSFSSCEKLSPRAAFLESA